MIATVKAEMNLTFRAMPITSPIGLPQASHGLAKFSVITSSLTQPSHGLVRFSIIASRFTGQDKKQVT